MPEQEYSLAELAACAEREAKMRRAVYGRKSAGVLTVTETRQLAMMEAIGRLLREAEADLASLSAPTAPPQIFPAACPRCCQRPDECIC